MILKILIFGLAKDLIGSNNFEITVKDFITVKEFKDILKLKYPKLKKISSFMIAVNTKYAKDSQKINQKDEIAIIPPTNGG